MTWNHLPLSLSTAGQQAAADRRPAFRTVRSACGDLKGEFIGCDVFPADREDRVRRKAFTRRDDGPCRGRRNESLRQSLSMRCIRPWIPSHSADLTAGSLSCSMAHARSSQGDDALSERAESRARAALPEEGFRAAEEPGPRDTGSSEVPRTRSPGGRPESQGSRGSGRFPAAGVPPSECAFPASGEPAAAPLPDAPAAGLPSGAFPAASLMERRNSAAETLRSGMTTPSGPSFPAPGLTAP